MAEEQMNRNSRQGVTDNTVDLKHRLPAPDYREETAAEIAGPSPIMVSRKDRESGHGETDSKNPGIGWAALALSILSLFVLPIIFGAAGIILGFVARRNGASTMGSWAIGIGAVSIIVGMFILPFF